MLKLRQAIVVEVRSPGDGVSVVELDVEVDGQRRRASADTHLVGACEVGDSVVVNIEAVELALGSGGRDIVLLNLSRGLDEPVAGGDHVMKLNYTPLQHAVAPVEPEELSLPVGGAAAVFQLHAQLPCVVWQAKQHLPALRIGYIQTAGGALPGGMSRTVAQLLADELLCDHITAAPAYGGLAEAMSTIGALHAGIAARGWDCAVVGPGPGIIGSATALGNGAMVALDSAHAALALGCKTVLVARASSGDQRPRHQGISHHTLTVLELLLGEVHVGLTASAPRPAQLDRHAVTQYNVDLPAYMLSGLPSTTMGRSADQDPLFFEQALAGGAALANAAG